MQARTRWWWIRHAATADQGIYLADNAALQIPYDTESMDIIASMLPRHDIWLASPERRSAETALLLKNKMLESGTEISLLASLRDQNFGEWTGQSIAKIISELKGHIADAAGLAPPQGESFRQVSARVAATIDTVHAGMEDLENHTTHIIAVAHASTIRAALAHALKLSPSNALHIHIDPLSLTCLDYYSKPEGWMVRAQNWSVIPKLY